MALTISPSDIVRDGGPLLQIKPHWKRVRLGDVGQVLNGFAFKAELFSRHEGMPLIRIRDVGSDASDTFYTGPYDDLYSVEAGDLLIGMDGDFKCARWRGPRSLLNQRVCKITVDESVVHARFLDFVLPSYLKAINDVTSSVTVKHLSSRTILDIPLPLPPMEEQLEIAAELDKQSSRLDEAVANLQRVRANLRRYKAAVLKAAVEGRLVETEATIAQREGRGFDSGHDLLRNVLSLRRTQWTKKGRYKEPAAPLPSECVDLPHGWAWSTVEQLNPGNRLCAYGVLQPGDDLRDGVAFVRVGDINDGAIDLSQMKRIAPKIAAAYPRTRLEGGEVLLTLVGAIGRTAVVPNQLVGANVARAVGVLPMNELVDPNWVEIWFRNPAKIQEMTGKSHEVARKTLNLEDVRLSAVALPPVAEQARIVAEVDHRLSILRGVEAEVDANLKRAHALRQSVLARAFSPSASARPQPVPAKASTTPEPVSVVLAAKIISALHGTMGFGRVKLQKLLFLATHHARVEAANDDYRRMQAGPLDMAMLKGVIGRLEHLRWFREVQVQGGRGGHAVAYGYERLSLADEYRRHLGALTPEQTQAVEALIALTRDMSTEECELLATVYAAWNDMLLWGRPVADTALVEQVRELWHESKRRFTPERILSMKRLIAQRGFEPTGFGKPTSGQAADTHTGKLFE